jgi:hypothetical protein
MNPATSLLKRSFFLLFVLGCLPAVTYSKCSDVREVDFKNRSYPLHEYGFTKGTRWLRVTNGRYEEPHDNPLNLAFLYFQVSDVVFGGLTGDKDEEAAVVALYGSNSGSFYLTDTYIFSCVAGKVKLIGILKQSRIEKDHTPLLIHESVKEPVSIKNRSLYVTHGTDGSRPSPEFITTFRYKITGAKMLPWGRPIKRPRDKRSTYLRAYNFGTTYFS